MTLPSDPEAEGDPATDPEAVEFENGGPAHPLRLLTLVVVAAAVWGMDLKTKMLAVDHLEWQPPWKILDGLVYLQLVRNPGAAFGMATGMTWLLTLIALGVVIAIIRLAGRLRSRAWAVALGLVLGGALGNLSDRLFRYPGIFRGWVVDMISVFAPDGQKWPVFNAADSAICTGGALLVVLALIGLELDGTRASRGNDE
jgi:signal peptidase II